MLSRSTCEPFPAHGARGELFQMPLSLGPSAWVDLARALLDEGNARRGGAAARRAILGWARGEQAARECEGIVRAAELARQGKRRELVELDAALTAMPWRPVWGQASQRIGREQLQRAGRLPGQRVAGYYAEAIERGDARGWHFLAYGVVVDAFGWPWRQSLLEYGSRMLLALVGEAARLGDDGVPWSEELTVEASVGFTELVDRLFVTRAKSGNHAAVG